MSLADTAKLLASLDLDNRKFNAAANQSMGKLNQIGVKGIAMGTALGQGLEHLAEAGLRKLGSALTGGIQSLADLESATTSVDGAIKQMGETGQVTSDQVATWANQIEASIHGAFDDTDITRASGTLIRFGHVVPANLRPAMVVMTDLAAKTGSVDSAATLLAKALADPTKAAGKLSRAGVVLTKTQQDQIRALVKAGKVGQAQKVILDALTVSTKGAADATQGPYAKSLSTLKDVERDVQRAFATGFLPVIERVRDILSNELAKPETLQRIKDFGQSLAGGLDKLVTIVQGLDWKSIGNSLKIAGDGAKTLLDAFMSTPDWLKAAVLTGWGLNKVTGGAVLKVGVDLLGGGTSALFQQFLGRGSLANPMVVVPVGGSLGGGAAGAAEGAAGAGGIGLSGVLASAAILVGSLVAAQKLVVEPGLQQQAGQNIDATQALIARGNAEEISTALAGLKDGLYHLDPLQAALYNLNADGVKVHTEGLEAALTAALASAGTKNLQPLPDKISAAQKQHFDALRSSIETDRIATVTRLDQAKNALADVRTATINQTAVARTGDREIVAAIHGIKAPVVHVTVNNRTVTSVYSTGRTVTRTASVGSYNAGLSG